MCRKAGMLVFLTLQEVQYDIFSSNWWDSIFFCECIFFILRKTGLKWAGHLISQLL